jgi:hypothetical protein
LETLVGYWNFTMKFWTDPNLPPAQMQGTLERKWIMDGRFVQETVLGQCATSGKTCEGMGLLGYNAAEKQFTCVRACGLSGTLSSSTVACDSSGKRFEGVKEETCPLTAQKVKARDELVDGGVEGVDDINAAKDFLLDHGSNVKSLSSCTSASIDHTHFLIYIKKECDPLR